MIDLGCVLGGQKSRAYSINDSGQIVGVSYDLGLRRYATLFDPTGNGDNLCLGAFATGDSMARSINNTGHIVGEWIVSAVLFDSTGGPNNVVLGASMAYSINDNGQIVGQDQTHALMFDPTGHKNNIDLGTLGGDLSNAFANNNQGDIVGMAMNNAGSYHATLFDSTGAANNIDLGTLGGDYSAANSINDSGQIVGCAATTVSSGDAHAILFDLSHGNIDLGVLGGASSSALGINNKSQIVGCATDKKPQNHATLFDPTGNGQNVSLNTLIDPSLGWDLQFGYDINNDGWIVGYGINPDGYERAYLLTPMATYCAEALLSDLNHDCRVDFLDLAIFVSQWLECRIEPPELCWQ